MSFSIVASGRAVSMGSNDGAVPWLPFRHETNGDGPIFRLNVRVIELRTVTGANAFTTIDATFATGVPLGFVIPATAGIHGLR
jgi:hypothetical protein